LLSLEQLRELYAARERAQSSAAADSSKESTVQSTTQ
jgi:hypothetical protein